MQPAYRSDSAPDELDEVLSHARIADHLNAPRAGWAPELLGGMVLLTATGLMAGTLSVSVGVSVLAALAATVVGVFGVGGQPVIARRPPPR